MGMVITGAGIAVPQVRQSAEELSVKLGVSAEWIIQRTGVRNRFVAGPEDTLEAMAASAARGAIGDGEKPDLLINASVSVRQPLPDTSAFILRELELDGVPGFSVHASCLSFLVALHVAQSLIESNTYSRILICSSEFGTRARDFSQPESAALLGDGAGAAIVEPCQGPRGIVQYVMRTWPAAAELTQVKGGGFYRHPFDPDTTSSDYLFDMDGPAVYRAALPRVARMFTELFARAGMRPDDVDLVVPHQPSARGLKALTRFGLPEHKIVSTIGEYGNCVAASLAITLATAMKTGKIRENDRVLLFGTGAGLSIGMALMKW